MGKRGQRVGKAAVVAMFDLLPDELLVLVLQQLEGRTFRNVAAATLTSVSGTTRPTEQAIDNGRSLACLMLVSQRACRLARVDELWQPRVLALGPHQSTLTRMARLLLSWEALARSCSRPPAGIRHGSWTSPWQGSHPTGFRLAFVSVLLCLAEYDLKEAVKMASAAEKDYRVALNETQALKTRVEDRRRRRAGFSGADHELDELRKELVEAEAEVSTLCRKARGAAGKVQDGYWITHQHQPPLVRRVRVLRDCRGAIITAAMARPSAAQHLQAAQAAQQEAGQHSSKALALDAERGPLQLQLASAYSAFGKDAFNALEASDKAKTVRTYKAARAQIRQLEKQIADTGADAERQRALAAAARARYVEENSLATADSSQVPVYM